MNQYKILLTDRYMKKKYKNKARKDSHQFRVVATFGGEGRKLGLKMGTKA